MLSTEALLIHFLKIVVVSDGMESLSCPLYSVFRRQYIVKLRQFVFYFLVEICLETPPLGTNLTRKSACRHHPSHNLADCLVTNFLHI